MKSNFEKQAEKVLDLASQRADSAEVFYVDSERIPVKFEDSKLQMLEASSSNGIALRLVSDGKMGFSASTKDATGEELVEKALTTAAFGSPTKFNFPEPNDYPSLDTFDPKVADLDADSMTETGAAILDEILKYEDELNVDVSVNRSTGRVRLLNTSGLEASARRTSASIICVATWVEDDSLLRVADALGSQFLYENPETIPERIVQQLDLGRKKAEITDGKYPVVFSPWAMRDLLRPILACVDGDSVSRGVSPWRDKIGEMVADERVSIYDDGLLKGGLATSPFDDEGIPSQKTPLIENGQLKNFLLDLKNSARLDMQPTGNGQRGSLTSTPGTGSTNICLEPGEISYEDMVGSIDEGLFVHELMGAWGSNPFGGQVSGNIALGFKIENGKMTGRIKDAILYVNAFEGWLNDLESISSDYRQILSYRMPYVMMNNVSVSAKG